MGRCEGHSDHHRIEGAVKHGKGAVRKKKELVSFGAACIHSNSGHFSANFGFKEYELFLDFVMHLGPQLRRKGWPWEESRKTAQVFLSTHGRKRSNEWRTHGVLPFAFGSTTASNNSCVNSCVWPVPRDMAQASNCMTSTSPSSSTGA